jgi:hypothetical protein
MLSLASRAIGVKPYAVARFASYRSKTFMLLLASGAVAIKPLCLNGCWLGYERAQGDSGFVQLRF